MNKMSKKLVTVLLLMGVGYSSSIYASVLHSVKTEQVVTKGATHINEKLLMTKGWRNVNVLKIDLSDDNISVKPMESATGLQKQTILQMVQDSNAVAGVNADYFDMGSSNSPSLGMLINEGNLSHGYNSNFSTLGINKNMATFMIDTQNTPSMEYYGVAVRINANGTFVGSAGAKNIVPNKVTRPLVFDTTYYKTTNNIVASHPKLYTIVVEDGIVTYRTKSGEGVTIPENGYVIMLPEALANEYYSKIQLGDTVDIQETLYLKSGLTKAVSEMKLGIGGSGIIMRNGEAYTGSAHAVTPSSNVARTVVATIKDSNEILLVTVDKGSGYVGINQSELVEVLKRYNVQDAMYLDGGGSTTFVARNEGSYSATLQNKPSDGSQRKVINGIGVYTTSLPGNLTKLIATPSSDRTFVGESISFAFKGTDENGNPVTVEPSSVTYSMASGSGDFSGNIFTPTSAGKVLVVAQCGSAETAIEINVSEKPTGLVIEPNLVQLGANSTKAVQVYGLDSEGYKIPVQAANVTWTSDNNQIGVTNNTVVSKGTTVGKVTASYKGATGVAGVIVGSTTVAKESFETNSGTWSGDTSTVTGSVFSTTTPVYHGKKSLKMTYTFKPSSNQQIAYTAFTVPMDIPADASSVNMWLHGKKQGHAAKLEVVDRNGKTHYLKLTDNINFTGWKYLSAQLPAEVALPAKVTKFYICANSVSETLTSAVYLDHFSITRGFREEAGLSARADYLADPLYKESLQGPTSGQYIINVVGPTRTDSMLLNNESISQISKKLSDGASLVLKASSKNSQLALNCSQYTYTNSYQAGTQNQTQFIMLGTGSGGIRTTDANGWIQFKQSIVKSNQAKNIIVVTSLNPLTQFKDALEGQAFHDYLVETREKTGQNIFVIYAGGTQPEVRIEDGIRYIRTNGVNVTTDQYQDGSFIKFKMDGDAVYYTIENFR